MRTAAWKLFLSVYIFRSVNSFINYSCSKSHTSLSCSRSLNKLRAADHESEVRIDEEGNIQTDINLRDFRARLVAYGLNYGEVGSGDEQSFPTLNDMKSSNKVRWAHEISAVEKGCVLLAREGMFDTSQLYFKNAVVLIIEHGLNGTAGLILNQPTPFRMGELIGRGTGLRELPGLEKNILYFGGDVGSNRNDGLDVVNLMHGRDDIPGTAVVSGVKLGGLKVALEKICEGSAQPAEFKFFSRYCGWAPRQLENEVALGAWFVAVCDVGTILDSHTEQQPEKLWTDILSRMGGKYSQLANKWKKYL